MSTLYQLQNSLQNYLLDEQNDIGQSIVASQNLSTATRLSIYHDAYRFRLLESLASNYPCLMAYLGEEQFQQAGFAYIKANPSRFRSIRWFGDKFAVFLADYYQNYPYLSELAEFEWKMTLAFDASDEDNFQLEQMAAIPAQAWGHMLLIPHPSLQCMNFYWNITSLWQEITDKKTLSQPLKSLEPTHWALWRSDYINRFYPLADDEALAMNGMMKGLNFGEICEQLCALIDEQALGMRAASLLKSWIQSGLIANIII